MIAGLSAANMFYSCGDKESKEIAPEPMTRKEAHVIREAPKAIEKMTYVVSEGDYLSKIALNEFGSENVYGNVKKIQNLNWSAEEIKRRDTHKTIEGRLVSGSDGLVDLIYPGEDLKLE